MNNIQIDTSQNVSIDYEIAGLGDRILAFLLDFLVKIGYLILIWALTYNMSSLIYDNVLYVFSMLAIALPLMFYTLLQEIFMQGQTIGKRALKIKVAKLDGSPSTVGSYLIRWLLNIIDIWTFSGGIAILTILINGKGQRLGDIAAGTTVIKLKQRANLADTLLISLPQNYQATYLQVTNLSDKDTNIVKETLEKCRKNADKQTISLLYNKVINMLGITNEINQTDYSDTIYRKQIQFLDTIVKDYFYLTGQ
jgi:uncharacterized RDD family membrane protein YckC